MPLNREEEGEEEEMVVLPDLPVHPVEEFDSIDEAHDEGNETHEEEEEEEMDLLPPLLVNPFMEEQSGPVLEEEEEEEKEHEEVEEEARVDPLEARLPGIPELDENNCYWLRVERKNSREESVDAEEEEEEEDEISIRVDALVGRHVEVYWADTESWYAGEVFETDNTRLGSHLVRYDDDAAEARRRKKAIPMRYSWLSGARPAQWDDPDENAQREAYRFI
jgi:hypothetical protein